MSKIGQSVMGQQIENDPDYLIYCEQYDKETSKQMEKEYRDQYQNNEITEEPF